MQTTPPFIVFGLFLFGLIVPATAFGEDEQSEKFPNETYSSLYNTAREDREHAATKKTVNSHIIGGTQTSAFPAVGILTDSVTGQTCTGTLIGQGVVLTAAHCVYADKPGTRGFDWYTSRYRFSVGSAPPYSGTRISYQVYVSYNLDSVATVPNPITPFFLVNDVAVVWFTPSITTGGYTLWDDTLPFVSTPPEPSVFLRVPGFGYTNANQSGAGSKMVVATYEAPVPVSFSTDATIRQRAISFGDSTHTSCGGDSGAPILFSYSRGLAIAGLVSAGTCTSPGFGPRFGIGGDEDMLKFIDLAAGRISYARYGYWAGIAVSAAGIGAGSAGYPVPKGHNTALPNTLGSRAIIGSFLLH